MAIKYFKIEFHDVNYAGTDTNLTDVKYRWGTYETVKTEVEKTKSLGGSVYTVNDATSPHNAIITEVAELYSEYQRLNLLRQYIKQHDEQGSVEEDTIQYYEGYGDALDFVDGIISGEPNCMRILNDLYNISVGD